MDSIIFLIPISIIFLVIAGVTLVWNIRNGQYDDMESPAHKILFDDDDELIPDDAKSLDSNKTQQPSDSKSND
jgi:cbb3-type cytochrome oxidase maturation protein